MTTLRNDLEARREEFNAHFDLAVALEDRMMLDASLGNISLSVRHINTIKSGLIVHLYNIEEAIMSQTLKLLGRALGSSDPRKWTEHSLKEWLRESIVSRITEGDEDGRLATVFQKSSLLLTQTAMGQQILKKPPGTWDDKAIAKFIRRMNVTFQMPPEMWSKIAATPKYGDMTPLQFLADRRNSIAHGRRSFEEGAGDLILTDIHDLASITLDYLSYTVDAFQKHVEENAHLVPSI